jgi:hypothetical protein
LGRTGSVKLSELNSSDATTRVYTTGTDNDLKRVNSNEVARSNAPSPAASGTGTLTDWMDGSGNGYTQWTAADETGSNMNLTTKTCQSPTSCKAIFSFDRPVGYTNFHQGSVQQQFFIKQCHDQATTSQCDGPSSGEEDNPLNGTMYIAGDGTSLDSGYHSNLQENKWYIGTVRMQWNDEVTPGSYIRDGANYTAIAQGSMSNSGYNKVDAIVFQMPAAPVCNGNDCGLGNSRINACDDLAFGSSQAYQTNNGSLSVGDTVYSSGCTSNLTGYIAFGGGSGYSYSLSSGVIQNDAQECEN